MDNERSFLQARERFRRLLAGAGVDLTADEVDRHGVDPGRFLMVGNSMRSDVLPVVEAGAWAVHIPAALSWSHEHADVPPHVHGRYFEVTALDRVPDVIEVLART